MLSHLVDPSQTVPETTFSRRSILKTLTTWPTVAVVSAVVAHGRVKVRRPGGRLFTAAKYTTSAAHLHPVTTAAAGPQEDGAVRRRRDPLVRPYAVRCGARRRAAPRTTRTDSGPAFKVGFNQNK
jgi:hypothetical protein